MQSQENILSSNVYNVIKYVYKICISTQFPFTIFPTDSCNIRMRSRIYDKYRKKLILINLKFLRKLILIN